MDNELTIIDKEMWNKYKKVDSGHLGEGGEPQPIQPTAQVVPALKNIDKAWYEATERYGPYNGHPTYCEDWNLESGGNTDLGEPLVAPFDGLVINASDVGGAWGKMVRIVGKTLEGELMCWCGAHLDEIYVSVGDNVAAGQDIGTIGTADGQYSAHLHEQVSIGEVPGVEIFGTDRRYDFRRPSEFYVEHGVDQGLMDRLRKWDGK